ncbi:MAG: hypothetical protein ABIV10_09965 [Gemmatimonadaceae bacterium]
MTVREWLDGRTPAGPAVLRARIDDALGTAADGESATATSACLAAAQRLVEELMLRDCASRESALDLLAADALVTYAFEAASESPTHLVQRATEAMIRMADLGASSVDQVKG